MEAALMPWRKGRSERTPLVGRRENKVRKRGTSLCINRDDKSSSVIMTWSYIKRMTYLRYARQCSIVLPCFILPHLLSDVDVQLMMKTMMMSRIYKIMPFSKCSKHITLLCIASDKHSWEYVKTPEWPGFSFQMTGPGWKQTDGPRALWCEL